MPWQSKGLIRNRRTGSVERSRRTKQKEMKSKDKPRRQKKKRFKKQKIKKHKPFNPWITKYFDLTGNGIESRDKNEK